MITEELTDAQIAERLQAIVAPEPEFSVPENEPSQATRDTTYRFVRPLTEAADNLIEYLQNSDGRIMTGLREIDLMTRGFGPGELVYVTGYTHSGKTQLFLTTVLNNRDRRFVLFTPDESAEDVLTKLVCMRTRSNAERMEERVKNGDKEACARIRRVAREDFRNLLVIDQSLSLSDMSIAVLEAEGYWGGPVDAVGFDYLELLRCDESEVEKKSQALKGWAVGQPFPTICLHQGSRGNSSGGQALTMRSMKYGGEQEAIFVLGVRRQRDDEDLDEYTRAQLADTVDISVIKNKRPPSKKGEHTFYMDPECGIILALDARANGPMTSASQARQRSLDDF